jgi:predicted enzyme related to lactoylglutathione lyase
VEVSGAGRFGWYQLLTTDVAGAADFYARVLGWRVDDGRFVRAGAALADIGPLPEKAKAAGAPAHWRGHIVVDDVDAALVAWIDRGGAVLGPPRRGEAGVVAAVRDPTGAVSCLSSVASARTPPGTGVVGWHQLNTNDRDRAFAAYAAVAGWQLTDAHDLGPPVGLYQTFAYAGDDGRAVGAIANTARTPGVHNAWLYYFDVADLDAAVESARALGAIVLGPMHVPTGDRVAVCDDPQGAAFGLRGP